MRKLFIGIVIALIAAGILFGVAAVSLNRIIDANRDQIVGRAQATLGRPLQLDRITLSVWGGLGVRLENVRIADDPSFAPSDFVRVAALTARARVWPLLHGRLEVARIDATQPQIHLIRNAAGQWNYATLPLLQHRDAPRTEKAAGSAEAAGPQSSPWLLALVNTSEGTLTVTDRSQAPPQEIAVTDIDLRVHNLGRSAPLQFELRAAAQSAARNIDLRGSAGPWAPDAATPIEVQGTFGPFGPHQLRVDALHLQAELTPAAVRVRHIEGQAFDGSFTLAATYPLTAGAAAALNGDLVGVAVGPVLRMAMSDAPQQVEGTATMKIDLHAAGGSAEQIRSSLAGSVAAAVQDGALKNFNLVNEVLGRATGLPGIGQLISNTVKPKYARLFSAPDTRFETLRATFTVGDQRLRTDDCVITATDYGVRTAGTIGFDRQADLSGTLAMSKAFSADVVSDVKEAKYLLDKGGQLAVPFRLRGRLGEAKPTVDSGYLVDVLSRSVSRGGVGTLLEKLLGSKAHNPQPPAGAQRQTPQPNPLEERLRNLLGR